MKSMKATSGFGVLQAFAGGEAHGEGFVTDEALAFICLASSRQGFEREGAGNIYQALRTLSVLLL